MAAPGIAAISVSLEGYSGSGKVATPALLGAMLRAADKDQRSGLFSRTAPASAGSMASSFQCRSRD